MEQLTELQLRVGQLVEEGYTFSAIAMKLGISPSGARQHYVVYMKKNKYQLMRNDYAEGKDLQEIANKHEVDLWTVRTVLGLTAW